MGDAQGPDDGRAQDAVRFRVAHAHGATVRCELFDTPLPEAQVNVVLRMLDRFGHLLGPAEIAARSREDPAALGPLALHRMTRDLERPTADEGFAEICIVPFEREHPSAEGLRPGMVLPLDMLEAAGGEAAVTETLAASPRDAAVLFQGWRPGAHDAALEKVRATARALSRATGRIVEVAFCPHPAGPPVCWCRPPLPGLWLAFARRHHVDLGRS